jgi:hypothetical protein
LEEPFTKPKSDDIIKELPYDKSPGPDGLNTDFIKKMLAYNCSRLL